MRSSNKYFHFIYFCYFLIYYTILRAMEIKNEWKTLRNLTSYKYCFIHRSTRENYIFFWLPCPLTLDFKYLENNAWDWAVGGEPGQIALHWWWHLIWLFDSQLHSTNQYWKYCSSCLWSMCYCLVYI